MGQGVLLLFQGLQLAFGKAQLVQLLDLIAQQLAFGLDFAALFTEFFQPTAGTAPLAERLGELLAAFAKPGVVIQ